MDIFFITWLGALGYCAVQTVRQYVRQKQVINLLYEGHPDDFLREIDQDIRVHGPTSRLGRALVINKSAGLCYLGRFEEAADLLGSLDVRWLPGTFQSLHRNNYLMVLLHLQRWDDARRLVEQNPRLLSPTTRAQTVNTAMRGTLAIYDLFCGDRERGKRVLGELIKMPDHDHMRAFRLYYLGLALLQEGQYEEAYGHFRLAASLAPYSFLPREVERLTAGR
jgi:tetratricopeptide (TPR) repeat protein